MIDGRALPRGGTEPQAAGWWGMVWLMVIEGLVVAALVTTWLYLRFHSPRWPPEGTDLPKIALPLVRTLLLVGAAILLGWAARVAPGPRLRGVLGAMPLVAAYLALGVHGLATLGFDWTRHAYGSIVWTLNGYALLHATAVLGVQGAVAAFLVRGHTRVVPAQVLALYAGFAAASAVLTFLVLDVGPHVLGR